MCTFWMFGCVPHPVCTQSCDNNGWPPVNTPEGRLILPLPIIRTPTYFPPTELKIFHMSLRSVPRRHRRPPSCSSALALTSLKLYIPRHLSSHAPTQVFLRSLPHHLNVLTLLCVVFAT